MNPKKQSRDLTPFLITSMIFSFLLGALTFFLIDKNTDIHPDRILNNVKREFRKDGPIEGSWIEMNKVPWSRYSYHTEVYYGGLSRFENGERKQLEFIADAQTGSIIDLYEI